MNELQIFNYGAQEVRTIIKDGEPWWVLKDVCAALGLSDARRVAERVDDDELTGVKVHSGGQVREMYAVNESGLYNVILRSDKPEAKKFKRWVTHEVLPSIRKHGAYMTPQKLYETMSSPRALSKLLSDLADEQDKNKALQAENAKLLDENGVMQPKAAYYDLILNCKDAVSITTIAKDYGKSGKWMNEYLRSIGVQYRQGAIWLLYQKHADQGYTCTKTHSYTGCEGDVHSCVHTYWTQKGRLFIYNTLKAAGILPLIEQELHTNGEGVNI